MDGAFLRHQQAGAHLDPHRPQGEGGPQLPGAGDATGGDHRYRHRIRHLGHQGHGGQFPHVAAAFGALGDDPVRPGLLHPPGQGGAGHHREDHAARRLPAVHVLGRVARPGGHHRHPLPGGDGGHLPRRRVHQHDVHPKGLAGQRPAEADVLLQPRRVHAAPGDDAQPPGVGDGGGEPPVGDVGHPPLEDRVFDLQPLPDICHFLTLLPYQFRGAPGEAAAEARQHQTLAFF